MNNHQELCLLSQQYSPVAMCLQETHIADISKVSFKGYTTYHRIDNSHDRASGGSSILIRNTVIHSPVNLNTNLQAPPDTWSCPTLGLASVLMLRPISPELVLFLDF